jgi:hypothetical protein
MKGWSGFRKAWSAGLLLTLLAAIGPILSPAAGVGARAGEGDAASEPLVATHSKPPTGTADASLDADWWPTVQKNIRKAEYNVTWQEETYLPDVPAAFQAPNRAHALRTYFASRGPIVIPRVWPEGSDAAPWRWGASLAAWGRGETLTAASAAVLHAEGNRIEYRRGEIVEWYRNNEQGLEQGFLLLTAPGGNRAPLQPVQLDLRLGGDLSPRLNEEQLEVEFRTGDGETMLDCGPLRVADAGGRLLPAWPSLEGDTLSILFDDTSATYPVQATWTIAGLPSTHDWVQSGGGTTSQFGFSVATAGDVNGDGYSDVIVGAPYYDGGHVNEGRAEVYLGWISGLQHIPIWVKESDQAGARYGHAVATAGDVNGDEYADIIVGAPMYDHPEEDEGGAWIYHGSASGPHSAPDNFDRGGQVGAEFGYSVATAGDVNGDGWADVIVGAPHYTNGQHSEGRVWVWHGSDSGISPAHDWRAESNLIEALMGWSVATAGDVNGDGYADIIVGAPYVDYVGSEDEGAAWVWYGSEHGVNNGVNGDHNNASWKVGCNQADASLGSSVSTAGDVNGDGYADVIVGAPLYDSGQEDEGAAWVYHGSDTGLNTIPANMDEGNQSYAMFGRSVATAGDVNGDGYADIVVGAPGWNEGYSSNGVAFVWYGHAGGVSVERDWKAVGYETGAQFGYSVATAGDVNGDGYSDILVGAPGDLSGWGSAYAYYGSASSLADEAGWTKASNMEDALFGFSVGTAGDVNADGYADIIVGAPRWDGGQVLEGGAWVYHGRDGGLNSVPAWDKFSDKAGAQFGWSVGTAGDVNGDGYSDVIVGAPTWNQGQVDEGMAFVYVGGPSGLLAPPNWSKASDNQDAQYGYAVGTAGDVNGDGYGDIIVGSPFYQEDGKAWVYLGSETGVTSAPHWHDDCDQAGSQFGAAVGAAGDVNGDGYSDVIAGAPMWDHGDNNEGGVFVYHGSSLGLATAPAWQKEGGAFDEQLGYAVGTAGDTDGDGYSDVIVGAPYASHGSINEGRAWVYAGSSTGLNEAYLWRQELDQPGAYFGWSVGTAGDVNGDGYADVIVGAHLWSGGEPGELYEGGAWVYHGGASGPHTAPDWQAEGNQGSAHLGYSVGTAGDVNGDGYADVIVGAPNYNRLLNDEGQAFVYFGNGGPGVSLVLRQLDHNGTRRIAPLGQVDSNKFRLGVFFWHPFGRGRQLLEIEAKPLGQRFDGTDTWIPGGSDSWLDPAPGIGTSVVTGWLRPNTAYHWRLRTLYHPATTPWMPASRWVTIPWNGWNEQDLRTGGGLVFLPVIMKHHEDE